MHLLINFFSFCCLFRCWWIRKKHNCEANEVSIVYHALKFSLILMQLLYWINVQWKLLTVVERGGSSKWSAVFLITLENECIGAPEIICSKCDILSFPFSYRHYNMLFYKCNYHYFTLLFYQILFSFSINMKAVKFNIFAHMNICMCKLPTSISSVLYGQALPKC